MKSIVRKSLKVNEFNSYLKDEFNKHGVLIDNIYIYSGNIYMVEYNRLHNVIRILTVNNNILRIPVKKITIGESPRTTRITTFNNNYV